MKLPCIISVIAHLYKHNLTNVLTHYIILAIIRAMMNNLPELNLNRNQMPLLTRLPVERRSYAFRRGIAATISLAALGASIKVVPAVVDRFYDIGRPSYEDKPVKDINVKMGDTVTSISQIACGDNNDWRIYANSVIESNNIGSIVDRLQPNTLLVVPDKC
jgi:hypothetical protein